MSARILTEHQGYSALPQYNMSYLVSESVAMGKPIIGVSINYRLAYFGFLASNEIQVRSRHNLQ
jgi:carboxylesterase type B